MGSIGSFEVEGFFEIIGSLEQIGSKCFFKAHQIEIIGSPEQIGSFEAVRSIGVDWVI